MADLIGRKKEKQRLKSIYDSGHPEFLVVYGRRRVGKTFLIREYFKEKFTFHHTALSPQELSGDSLIEKQLQNFTYTLNRYGARTDNAPRDWFEAFNCLINLIESKPADKRQVVFIDEMPWLDTPRSGFVTAFEHFWNGWAAGRSNLMLIVCGSATSWISDKLLGNKGGLYGRVTQEMHIAPFTLTESEEYFRRNSIAMSRYDILQCYMATGGVPYYLSFMEKGKSVAQNIDELFFSKRGRLTLEFDRMFASLFTSPETYIKVIRLLALTRGGCTRSTISERTGITSGGGLSKILQALEVSDFITPYHYYRRSKRETYYKFTDFFSLFYLRFAESRNGANPHFWQENQLSPKANAWRGLAFEDLCFTHIEKIKRALGIEGMHTEVYPWHTPQDSGTRDGAQIDLVIERADRTTNLCEMKFSISDFRIDKAYEANIRNKISAFSEVTGCRKTIHTTLITTYGLVKNEYSGIVQKVITMDDLF